MSQLSALASAPHWCMPAGMKYLGPHQASAPMDITLVLRRRPGNAPDAASWPRAPRWQRGEFGQHCGAEPADLESLRRFAGRHGLSEIGAEAHRRVLHLRAAPQALERAFGVTLGKYQLSDGRGPFVGCGHAPALPPEAIAVLGLDRRPVARVRSRRPRAVPSVTYTPIQLGALYSFPAGTDGSGETVAIIELGGGFTTGDLAQYFRSLGIARAPTVTAVGTRCGAQTLRDLDQLGRSGGQLDRTGARCDADRARGCGRARRHGDGRRRRQRFG